MTDGNSSKQTILTFSLTQLRLNSNTNFVYNCTFLWAAVRGDSAQGYDLASHAQPSIFFNPLSPNINIQILQTDLSTFIKN